MERQFNDVKIKVEFNETQTRQQISSGDEIKSLFGKIRKWLADLKPIAFSGKFSDLTEIPQYTPKESGIYKITVDSYGNISSASPVSKQDMLDLGITTEYEFGVDENGHFYYEKK